MQAHLSLEIPKTIASIRSVASLSQEGLARYLGVSFVSVNRWERGASSPSPAQAERILRIKSELDKTGRLPAVRESHTGVFASHGVRNHDDLPLFQEFPSVQFAPTAGKPILSRIREGDVFHPEGPRRINELLDRHPEGAKTATVAPASGVSAGKNSYTYDAHTYHTKVPPQGIAELILHYLPEGGLVLDPFGGSGMTGVAASATGNDCILNELSPAACFISSRFVSRCSPAAFREAVRVVLEATKDARHGLYTTSCRECGKDTELLYVVWSYRVECGSCGAGFQLWDVCRRYGKRVRDHKILKEFDCPHCHARLHKSRLKRRNAEPVQVGYKCCGSRQQEQVHELDEADRKLIQDIATNPPTVDGFYPTNGLPDGVNLSQPKRHGLTSIDKFYSPRNLAAMSQLWHAIHRLEDANIAAHVAFVFTSLYQRVTKLSEFRFWGGSGNTARFNVPYVFNESNVFVTFERKARTIQDHLESTATHFSGDVIVANNSATSLDYLSDASVDFIFTDPPFGANINYSEMNVLWESWLGDFTDATDEAIVNRAQGKDVAAYGRLMARSLAECYRVLRPNHWLVLMFMNTSARVWEALRDSIIGAGFEIRQVDSFDKQHATFKQFVSENAAGEDLVIHCHKPSAKGAAKREKPVERPSTIQGFLDKVQPEQKVRVFLHVGRDRELDVQRLYSEWMAECIKDGLAPIGFAEFRQLVEDYLKPRKPKNRRP